MPDKMTDQERERRLSLIGERGLKQARQHSFVTSADVAGEALERGIAEAVVERRLKASRGCDAPDPKKDGR